MLIFTAMIMCSACGGGVKHPVSPGAGSEPLGHYDPSADIRNASTIGGLTA
jgi:hypothetical protein